MEVNSLRSWTLVLRKQWYCPRPKVFNSLPTRSALLPFNNSLPALLASLLLNVVPFEPSFVPLRAGGRAGSCPILNSGTKVQNSCNTAKYNSGYFQINIAFFSIVCLNMDNRFPKAVSRGFSAVSRGFSAVSWSCHARNSFLSRLVNRAPATSELRPSGLTCTTRLDEIPFYLLLFTSSRSTRCSPCSRAGVGGAGGLAGGRGGVGIELRRVRRRRGTCGRLLLARGGRR